MADENTYELIGRATVAWSDVELTWYLIYLTLTDSSREQADAIYFTPRNSNVEQKIVYSLAEVVFVDMPLMLTNLSGLLKRTNGLTGDRNAIAHGKYIFSREGPGKAVDLWAIGKNKLIGKPLGEELGRLEKEFLSLADDLTLFLFQAGHYLRKELPSIEK